MNILLETMFRNRGYDENFLNNVVSNDYNITGNINVLCNALKVYHDNKKLIVVATDFDLDGLMSGVIGYAGLAELGFNVALYLPSSANGYGFRELDVDLIMKSYPDVAAIITGDVGITAHYGIDYAKQHGIDVFVTDHHAPSDTLPDANVVVDPCIDDDTVNSYPRICGAHVMWQVVKYYAEHYTVRTAFYCEQMDRLRVFAGFGTISDGMPVFHSNRYLIKDAVSICKLLYQDDASSSIVSLFPGCTTYLRTFEGLSLLLHAFAEDGKITRGSDIDEDFIAFYVAPTFNSIKRMSKETMLAYDIFFNTTDAAIDSIQELFALNQRRKDIVAEAYASLLTTPQLYDKYIYISDAEPGILGLLAQKLLSETGEPALVLNIEGMSSSRSGGILLDDEDYDDNFVDDIRIHGSGRCPAWFPYLDLCRERNVSTMWAAGHNPAFGCGFADLDALDDGYRFISEKVAELNPGEVVFTPDFTVSTFGDCDAILDLDLIEEYLDEISVCKPFGRDFEKPVSKLTFRNYEGVWHIIGKDRNHLKIDMLNGVSILCFNQGAELIPVLTQTGVVPVDLLPPVIEVIGDYSMNDFRGMQTIQFMGTVSCIDTILLNAEKEGLL